MTIRVAPNVCECVFEFPHPPTHCSLCAKEFQDKFKGAAFLCTLCERHKMASNPLLVVNAECASMSRAVEILDAAGATYTWSFTADGTLQIHTVGASAANKSTWTAAITPKATVPFTVL